jgi:hypothetical protein
MIEVIRDIGDLGNRCLQKGIFNFDISHYLYKLLFCYHTVSLIQLRKLFSQFALILFVSLDYLTQNLNIFILMLLVNHFRFPYEFFHLFHELFGAETLLACWLVILEKIYNNYLHLMIC